MNSAGELVLETAVNRSSSSSRLHWQKRQTLRVADDFLRERAATAKPKHLLEHLRRAPKVAPNADDTPQGCD